MRKLGIALAILVSMHFLPSRVVALKAQVARPKWLESSMAKLKKELFSKCEKDRKEQLLKGMKQVGEFWHPEDGDASIFENFVRTNFANDKATLDTMFNRLEHLLEKLDGHMHAIGMEFRTQADLDLGPVLPFDEIFAGYNPAAHLLDDFFENKLAFVVLLNFPLTTLEQRLTDGEKWSRRQWAEARLARRFSKRIPAEVNLDLARAAAEADNYVAGYNIWMHHLLDKKGKRLFPPKMRLLSHWNLRDELKARYSEGKAGLPKQRMIQKVMEMIVNQTIPAIVIDNPHVDWNPFINEVNYSQVRDSDDAPPAGMKISSEREPDARYETILKTFHASRKVDPYSPTAPTLIARRFDESREIPEARVEEIFEQVLTSPLVGKLARLIESRLGRPLEPFDIWYNGFRAIGALQESDLELMVSRKYPTAEAYEKDIPNLLMKLGFSRERAGFLAAHIAVDPARGSGHAWGPEMRSQQARLRTRVGKDGMDYKGFNIAVHEMGHNVEQVLSLEEIDHTLLRGVPNTAFTEAMAFVFQGRDLELLNLTGEKDVKSEAMKTLDDFWGTFEIAGVALVDMGIWHWMYDHPDATPAELREATIQVAKNVWNKYFAPHFAKKDVYLLAIYSHILHSFLYIPDYPLGHLIAVQIEEQMKKAGNVGSEFERMVTAGNIAPDLWMQNATGQRVGAEALLSATKRALEELGVK